MTITEAIDILLIHVYKENNNFCNVSNLIDSKSLNLNLLSQKLKKLNLFEVFSPSSEEVGVVEIFLYPNIEGKEFVEKHETYSNFLNKPKIEHENELPNDLKVLQYLKSLNKNDFVEIGEFLESIGVNDYSGKIEILELLKEDKFIEYFDYNLANIPLPQMGNREFIKFQTPAIQEFMLRKNPPKLESSDRLMVKILEKGKIHLQKELNKMSENNKSTNIINIGGNVEGSQIGVDLTGASNTNKVNQTPVQNEPAKKTIWSNIPEWAKILGGIGAIAGLVKTIIELNKP